MERVDPVVRENGVGIGLSSSAAEEIGAACDV